MSLEIQKPKSKQVGLRLSAEAYSRLKLIAKKEKVAVSNVVRAIINEWNKKH